MTAAICPSCEKPIRRKTYPVCPNCRLLVVDNDELDLDPSAPIEKIYSDDDEDGGGGRSQ